MDDVGGRAPSVGPVVTAVLLAYLAQMTLNPVLAPLSRAVGLREWQIGLTISTAAVVVVLCSGPWARRAQVRGPRPVLLTAFALAAAATALFALVAWAGTAGLLGGAATFGLFLLLRGVLFGVAIAAVVPTAQVCVATATGDEPSRVRGMAAVGAAQGVAMIAGSALGGVLSAFDLLAPVVVVPLLAVAGVLLVVARVRARPVDPDDAPAVRVSVRDPRVLPFLLAAFGMFTALGLIQVVCGFMVQDRLGLEAGGAGAVTGAVLLAAGLGMVLAQVVVVPRSGWAPVTLLRAGGAVALGGFVVLVPDLAAGGLLAGVALVGLGLGTALPGVSAGTSLRVGPREQGAVAGLVAATLGLTFVVAPTLGTTLYGLWAPAAPLAGVVVLAVVLVGVVAHPAFRG